MHLPLLHSMIIQLVQVSCHDELVYRQLAMSLCKLLLGSLSPPILLYCPN